MNDETREKPHEHTWVTRGSTGNRECIICGTSGEPDAIRAPDAVPAIRIGSRWRNKAHGFVFRLLSFESLDSGTWVKLYERNASDGFSWAGLESQLLQQWEPIEP